MSDPIEIDTVGGSSAESLARLSTQFPVSARTVAVVVTFVSVTSVTGYQVVHNAPGGLPRGLTALATNVLPVAVVGPAVAALVLAAVAIQSTERVGLAFAGGFGLISVLSPSAWLPGVIAIVCGGGLVGWSHARRQRGPVSEQVVRVLVPALLVTGLGVSLAATAGVAPGTLRPLGSSIALVGVGAIPLLVGHDRRCLLLGALAALLVVGVAANAPYVTGAVLLAGGGVVGVPLGVVALAVGGGVAGMGHALGGKRYTAALAVGVLLVAGVPATLVGALAVVVSVALLTGASSSTRTSHPRRRGGGRS